MKYLIFSILMMFNHLNNDDFPLNDPFWISRKDLKELINEGKRNCRLWYLKPNGESLDYSGYIYNLKDTVFLDPKGDITKGLWELNDTTFIKKFPVGNVLYPSDTTSLHYMEEEFAQISFEFKNGELVNDSIVPYGCQSQDWEPLIIVPLKVPLSEQSRKMFEIIK